MWYVYFLEFGSGDTYIGSTPDLKRRFNSHAKGHVTSTKAFLPVKLAAYVAVDSGLRARKLER
jgi:putative endonuclease